MRYAIFLILASAFAFAETGCRGCGDGGAPAVSQAAGSDALDRDVLPDAQVVCPVCGLEFNGKESVATRAHEGKNYYFLLEDHARAFAASPEAYLDRAKP